MLYKIVNGSVSYGADTVLEYIDFEIKDREKIAVVGRNGSGKTTLLKAITGEVTLEEGTGEDASFSVVKSGNSTVGYLKQISFSDENASLLDEVKKVFLPLTEAEEKMAELVKKIESSPDDKTIKAYAELCEKYEVLGGYTYKKEYSTMIKKFGFSEEDKLKPLSEFSGGERTKIAFIKLLLSKPDILLLDEPTNHLDVANITWLEDYLKNYKSAIVIVSHDRLFLDRIVNKVYEIEYGETKKYAGTYSDFERQKRENHLKQLKDHEIQRAEIERLTRLIERFRYKATKARMVQSKIKQIERMKIVDAPDRYDLKSFRQNLSPAKESARKVLEVKGLSVGYTSPLAKIDFELFKGQKLGVIGANGIGKSTFLKTLVGILTPLGGNFAFGANVTIGYFDQQMAHYSSGESVYDNFIDDFPQMNQTEARTALGSFLFTGEDVFKSVSELSGGERVRLALAKILYKRPNLLILDEPTNHMDIVGKETLENMLSAFEGTAIFVSHDRYFISKIADVLLVFKNGKAEFIPETFSEYDAKEKEKEKNAAEEIPGEGPKKPAAKKSFSTPLKDKSRKERRLLKLEELIKTNEAETERLNAKLGDPAVYSNYKKVMEIQNELEILKKQADEYGEEWLEISLDLEETK